MNSIGKDSDIQFTYDVKPFVDAMNQMTAAMGKMTKNSDEQVKNISKGVTRGMLKFSAIGAGIVGLVKTGIDALNKYVPEVSQTFSIAKDIVFRNFMYPLRKMLLPMLQSVLNWARKNRAMFVQLGETVVNVFKAGALIVKGFVKLLEPVLKPITELIKRVFGGTSKTIAETINVAIFKITAFVIYLQTLLGPVFGGLGDLLQGTLSAIEEFSKGFINSFLKLFKGDYFKDFKNLGEVLSQIGDVIKKISPIFKTLGEIIGLNLLLPIKLTVTALQTLLETMSSIFEIIKNPKDTLNILNTLKKTIADNWKSTGTSLVDAFKDMGTGAVGNIKQVVQNFSGQKVEDAIITKGGQVIKTHPDDNIIATKSGGMGRNVIINKLVETVNLNVTEGNARQTGMNFIGGLEQGIKNILRDSAALEGGR